MVYRKSRGKSKKEKSILNLFRYWPFQLLLIFSHVLVSISAVLHPEEPLSALPVAQDICWPQVLLGIYENAFICLHSGIIFSLDIIFEAEQLFSSSPLKMLGHCILASTVANKKPAFE